MLRALYRTLNVRPSEEGQVLLLLGTGFTMGIFLATFTVVAETLFMNRLSDYLQEAILVSGFLGIISTYVFAKLQERFKFSLIYLAAQLSIFFITSFCYSVFHFFPEFEIYVIFLMFCLSGPFLAVLLLGFWGVFGRLFDLRQSKRIIGGIDVGQLVASILAFFTIPLLEGWIPDTENFLTICGVSILLSAVFLYRISSKYDLSHAEVSKMARSKKKFRVIFKDQYVRLLSGFLIFSMVTFTFVQYTFLEVSEQQYPNENELRNFFALFNGFILVLGLLLQTFVNNRIITQYGLKVSLMIHPVILAIFTILVIGIGKYYGFTAEIANENFVLFFLFVALSRLFNYSLRDSLENPVFKLYFMPLDSSERFDIQTKVEGVVNESARFVAGLVIFGLSFLPFVELIHYSYVLIFLLSGYFIIIGKLYLKYRTKIRDKLEVQQQNYIDENEQQQMLVYNQLNSSIEENKISRVIFSFKLLEKLDPERVPQLVNKLMGSPSEEIRNYAQMRMIELKGLSVSTQYVINMNEDNQNIDKKLVKGFDLEELLTGGGISNKRIASLSRSDNTEDRLYAVELLSNSEDESNILYLVDLLKDNDFQVRVAAIKAARIRYNKEVLNTIISNLKNPLYANYAMNTLVLIGESTLGLLDSAFYRTEQSLTAMIKLVQVMGRIGGKRAIEQLWNKIDYPDKIIVSHVLLSLGQCNFKANISQITRIKFAIEADIANIAYNLGSIDLLSGDREYEVIYESLKEEVQNNIDHIYMLLGMLYDHQSIQLVKENIDSKTNEGLTYGLELLDVFLSEDLKQKILPVLDDISISEKVRRLEQFYVKPDYDRLILLKLLLNRDINQTNRFTKATIIEYIGLRRLRDFIMDLIAQMFNPDKMLREMAAWALYKIDPMEYHENTSRLKPDQKRQLDEVIISSEGNKKFDKVKFLQDLFIFSATPGIVLTQLVDMISEIRLGEGKMLSIDSSRNNYFFIVRRGSVNLYEDGSIKGNIQEGEFLGEVSHSTDTMKSGLIIAVEDSELYSISKDQFYDLLSENIQLAEKVVEFV